MKSSEKPSICPDLLSLMVLEASQGTQGSNRTNDSGGSWRLGLNGKLHREKMALLNFLSGAGTEIYSYIIGILNIITQVSRKQWSSFIESFLFEGDLPLPCLKRSP